MLQGHSYASSGNEWSTSNVVSSSRRTYPFSASSAWPSGGCSKRTVATANVLLSSWCAMRRGCSPSGMVLMCSFWMLSIVPMVKVLFEAIASESGNDAQLKLHICVTSRTFTLLYMSLRLALYTTVGRSEPANTCVPFSVLNGRSETGCVPSDSRRFSAMWPDAGW